MQRAVRIIILCIVCSCICDVRSYVAGGHQLLASRAKLVIKQSIPSSTLQTAKLQPFHTSLQSSTEDDATLEATLSPRRLSYLALWVGLLAYTTDFSSHISAEAAAVAPQVLNTAIFTPFDGTLSPVFVTLFFFLGILPTVYGSLLLPSAKQQKVWALPFVASSFALGFFGMGPYLGLRNKSPILPALTPEDRDTGSILFDNKFTPILLLASTVYLVYYAFNGAYIGDDRWQGFLDLFNSQPLARISSIDFTILSLAVSEGSSPQVIPSHRFLIHK